MRGRLFAASIVTSLGAAGLVGAAQAAPVSDNYIGANAHGSGDVIGNVNDFQINSIDVTRVGNDVKVVVNTVYNPNSSGALGTGLGDLFFGTDVSKMPTLGATSVNDTYVAGRFNYVFDINNSPNPGVTTGSGSLRALLTGAQAGTDIKKAFAPGGGGTIRDTQAVAYNGSASAITGGSWTLDAAADTLTFLITNGVNTLGTSFFVAWAMTCANDIIYAQFTLPPGGNEGQVPLPAGFLLMGTVLLGAGGVARWRKRRMAQAAA